MFRFLYIKILNKKSRQTIKRQYYKLKNFISKKFFSYDINDLKKELRDLGIKSGDTVMAHTSFSPFNGFKGRPQDIINCLQEIIGDQGNLLMVSLPYTTSSMAYLNTNPVFKVNKTVSKMGIISEIFRRRKDVLRSMHPTHPVVAWGKNSTWIVQDHHKCTYPCGKGSPFAKFRSMNGKILFFDVPFRTFTFIHHIEDLIKDKLFFSLYSETPMIAKYVDQSENTCEIPVYVFSENAVNFRKPDILKNTLVKNRLLKRRRIGNTRLMLVSADDAVNSTYEMLEKGSFFFTKE